MIGCECDQVGMDAKWHRITCPIRKRWDASEMTRTLIKARDLLAAQPYEAGPPMPPELALLLDDYAEACKRLDLIRELMDALTDEAREHSTKGQYHSARVKYHTADRIRHKLRATA